MSTHRCFRMAAGGGLLGVAAVAFGQTPSTPESALLGDELSLVLELLRVGGLPGILAYLAFQAGRMIDSMAVTVRLHEEDRRLLERHCERADPAD